MKTQEHYETDLLFFFDGKPLELSLYEMLFRRMEAAFPAASVRVQKSQISFYIFSPPRRCRCAESGTGRSTVSL